MAFHADKIEEFKAVLERHHQWPCEYVFKFIVKHNELEHALSVFSKEQISMKNSSNGKYTSLTWSKTAQSSDEIIAVYLRASEIQGIIAI
ncbi:DUF493 domain-containing protein [bacterium]|jgi:putative lipoic acid-binding regulatory protein|nr:DUF493 domain-containing protein [bacterium]